MEHAWRKSKLDMFYFTWRDSALNYKCALHTAKTAHSASLINNNNTALDLSSALWLNFLKNHSP